MARGFIRGTHHLTFCVGGAQEDYDFHVRLLGLKSVKKTVLFDGEIPIYHLYYGNGLGDPSTLLTAFPYRQAGWMGKRGTNQAKPLNLSVPVGLDRLLGRPPLRAGDRRTSAASCSGPSGCSSATRAGSSITLVGDPDPDDREPYDGASCPPSTRSAAPTARRRRSASPTR